MSVQRAASQDVFDLQLPENFAAIFKGMTGDRITRSSHIVPSAQDLPTKNTDTIHSRCKFLIEFLSKVENVDSIIMIYTVRLSSILEKCQLVVSLRARRTLWNGLNIMLPGILGHCFHVST